MPALVYPTGDFQPFTKILSSEVNGKFNAITTLLNVTKLDTTNVQQYGLAWDRLTLQTSNQVVITDTIGQLSFTQALPSINGGIGFSFVPTISNASQVLQVDTSGSALTFGTTPEPPTSKIYSFYRFG